MSEREDAWERCLSLFAAWENAEWAALGGSGGGGYRDPHALTETKRLRAELDQLIRLHGFEQTRVDPMTPWAMRQELPWTAPEPNPTGAQ